MIPTSTPPTTAPELEAGFHHPDGAARLWVYWYWMHASVSREGISADLEAMKQSGIGGAYLMPIGGVQNPPLVEPPVAQMSPLWWDMVRHAAREAGRLGLELAMHACDGFALAGGPWISPELSMQKVVWSETHLEGETHFDDILPQPPANENFYRDIAVLVFPTLPDAEISSHDFAPQITASSGENVGFLGLEEACDTFRSAEPCWIQLAFGQPFTCRSLRIRRNGNNVQANRLRLEASDDGTHFRFVAQLAPPRHGWQDTDAEVTHSIPATTARFFRFHFDAAGSEPGGEDLDGS